jgi:hypothetical protein
MNNIPKTPNKMRFFSFPLLFSIIASCFWADPLAAQGTGWKLKRDADGMKVYYRKAEHSSINELKMEVILEGSMSAVVAVLRDVPAYPQWIYKCTQSKRLKPLADHSGLYYCQVEFPWPMSNRDFIAQSKLWQDPKTKHVFIEVESQPAYLAEKKDLIRIQQMSLKYELIPLSGGKVKMLYYLHSDPGGALPAWLVNMFLDNGPLNTIKGLREMLKRPDYQQAQLAFLQE